MRIEEYAMTQLPFEEMGLSLALLEQSTRSLVETSTQLGTIYFGPSGLEEGFIRFAQITDAGRENIEQLQSSLSALGIALEGVGEAGGNIGQIDVPSFGTVVDEAARFNSQLSASGQQLESLNAQLDEIPLKFPDINQGFIAVADSVDQANQAQSFLNASIEAGIALHGEELAQAVISAAIKKDSAKDASLAIIRAKFMEAMVGYIASVFSSVPFPANLVLAAGAELAVGKLLDTSLAGAAKISIPKFAQGGDFITSGPQLIMVGDNPSGRERVQITPSEQPIVKSENYYITIMAPLVDETVIDFIGPAIEKARRLGKTDIMTRTYDAN